MNIKTEMNIVDIGEFIANLKLFLGNIIMDIKAIFDKKFKYFYKLNIDSCKKNKTQTDHILKRKTEIQFNWRINSWLDWSLHVLPINV